MAWLTGEVAAVLGFSLLNSFKLYQTAKHFGEMQDEKLLCLIFEIRQA
jgi:hypothetical protein